MPLFPQADRKRVEAISDLVHCNPFLPERIALERAFLGAAFDESTAEWNVRPDWGEHRVNVDTLADTAEAMAQTACQRLVGGFEPTPQERRLYEDLVLLGLYYRTRPALDAAAAAMAAGQPVDLAATWDAFAATARRLTDCLRPGPDTQVLAQWFAFAFQFRRAFQRVFDCIIGVSEAAVRLRVQVWQSIFTHDMRRFRRVHFDRMADFTTLITGPSGTGKELVARAIGMSRFIPFDPRTKKLAAETGEVFFPLNLSALSSQLIESELFGHKRGAFTGAVSDRKGWLEVCPRLGSVLLDEMGEIDHAIQVKLLRVLEDRTFSRVGEAKDRRFAGKIIAATNRDLAVEMREGRFRTDLYYRLCGDVIRTPSLAERVAGNEAERHLLLTFLARRELPAGCEDVVASVVADVERWIDSHLGRDYPWPGNVRELDQCLRNIMIRREYHPATVVESTDACDELATAIRRGEMTADDLMRRYCALVYAREGSFEGAARRLRLDRRTVRAKVESAPG